MFKKITSLILSFSLIITQPVFAQGVAELNIGKYLNQMPVVKADSFRPAHLRYISYDIVTNDFKLLLDQGDAKLSNSPNSLTPKLQYATQELFNYFLIGLSLPNDKFWVNLRPDAPQQIIDPLLEKTDMGKIMLEADLQLKKDTAGLTSPQNPEGKEYWDKLYKKAGELFGTENITIPTITRPWIVPGEVIIRESEDSAYIYKANLKVMLEEDYLNNQKTDDYNFSDPRMKELNRYSTQLIKELILPRLTQEINTSKKYAQLRQVFFSLILSRWFKDKYQGSSVGNGLKPFPTINSGDLTNLTSQDPWNKDYYFNEYKKSFQQGEYNLKEQVSTPTGQVIRSYVSGGIKPVPEDISSFRSVGSSSPIDLEALIPIATTISIVGLIYTLYKMHINSRVGLLQKEYEKLTGIRNSIRDILSHYVDNKLLTTNDATIVNHKLSDYKSFELEETILAVEGTIKLLKSFKKLSDVTQQKAREEVIVILERSLQAIDKTTGSSALVPQEGAYSETQDYIKYREFARGIAGIFEDALVKYRKRIQEINYPNSVFELFPGIEEEMYVKNTKKIVVIDFDRVYGVLEKVYVRLHSTLAVIDFPREHSEILVEFRDAVSDLKQKMSEYGSSPLAPREGASSAVGFFEGRKTILKKLKKDINSILEKIIHSIPNNHNEIEQKLHRHMDVIRFSRDIHEILRTAGDTIEYSKKNMIVGVKEIEDASSELNDIAKEIYIHMRNCYKEMIESFIGNYRNKKHLERTFERVYEESQLEKIFSDIGYISDGKFRLRENKIISAGKLMRKILFATRRRFASSDYYNRRYERHERFKDALEEFKNVKTFIYQRNKAKASSSLTQDISQTSDYPLMPGGIDFTQINYLTRPMGSFHGLDLRLPLLSKAELEGIDINREVAAIEQMINAKIDVSSERLKRLLAAMSQKDAFNAPRETQLLPLLLRLCWLKEEKGSETTPDFRAVLLIADTGLFVEQGDTRYSLN